jgi:threonine-phosphate decarboxylase
VAPLLDDDDFMTRMRAWLADERPRLKGTLETQGLRVVPSHANFFLAQPSEGPGATPALFERLLRRGILARHTHNFAGLDGGWLRLALRDRADNDRLLAALAEAGGA